MINPFMKTDIGKIMISIVKQFSEQIKIKPYDYKMIVTDKKELYEVTLTVKHIIN